MANELELKSNITDAAQHCHADLVKTAFCVWLSNGQVKQTDYNNIIDSLDNASEQLIRRKISYTPLWEITKPSAFADVYNKARDNKLFRIMDKKTYSAFIRDGQLYLKFLKTKPNFQPEVAEPIVPAGDVRSASTATIKEAVIVVLRENAHAMTAEEIYSKIIEHRLYKFGAQNPVNVVRTTIEYACENSGYSNKDAVPSFRFERNGEGKRVYSLLEETDQNVDIERDFDEKASTERNLRVRIWNNKVEQEFQRWLERENYAQKTADNYRRAAAQIFRNYAALAYKAVIDANCELNAVRKYIALLNEESSFIEANSLRHNQFTASLSALERFYASGVNVIDSEDDETVCMQSDVKSVSAPLLDDIVDLDEGKAGIRQILDAHFQTLHGYSNISILWNAAQDTLSMFLNDNAINNADDLWRFMQSAFSCEYVLSNPHIWKVEPNYPQSYVGVIVNLARQLGGTVNREQIDDYFARIKQSSPINANIIRQGLLVFYASKHFILTELINLTRERCEIITKALDRLFDCADFSYIVLRDITDEWFSFLPAIKGEIPWTALLLQEVLRLRPTIGYRVIFSGLNGQALDTLGAAIVPSKSDINGFPDVVHQYCYEKNLLAKRIVTEDLRIILRDAGMLEGNELIYNLHKALKDYRFAFTDENRMVKILER